MSTSQERVYGLVDIATKPIQWFIGGLTLLFLVLCGIGVLVWMAIQNSLAAHTIIWSDVTTAALAIFALATFCVAPYYVVVFGPICFLAFGWFVGDPVRSELALKYTYSGGFFKFLVFLWFLFGFVQGIVRMQRKKQREALIQSYQSR